MTAQNLFKGRCSISKSFIPIRFGGKGGLKWTIKFQAWGWHYLWIKKAGYSLVRRLGTSRANQLFSCFTAAGKVKGVGHKNKKQIFSEKEKTYFLFCKYSLESELERKLKGLEAKYFLKLFCIKTSRHLKSAKSPWMHSVTTYFCCSRNHY